MDKNKPFGSSRFRRAISDTNAYCKARVATTVVGVLVTVAILRPWAGWAQMMLSGMTVIVALIVSWMAIWGIVFFVMLHKASLVDAEARGDHENELLSLQKIVAEPRRQAENHITTPTGV